MSLFDPFGLLSPRSGDRDQPGTDRVRDWLDATSQWADPRWWLSQGPGARTAQRTLLSLAAGVAERFTGRQLEVRAGDRTIRGVLDAVRVDAPSMLSSALPGEGAPVEVRVLAHDVEVDGVALDSVVVTAHDVTLQPGVPASISAGPVDIEVCISEANLTVFLRRWVPEPWELDTPWTGRVSASRADLHLLLELEPQFRGDDVRVELRAVSWRGVRVVLPGWLRLSQRRELPPLPGGMELVEVWQGDGVVRARIRLPHHVEQLRLDRLRDAVARDEATIVLGDDPA
jgi:hypothetical protein